MKNLRPQCWIWIVAATTVLVLLAPVSVTYRYSGYSEKDDTITKTEWIGPLGSPREYIGKYGSREALKSSLDLSRLIVVLFAANFLPALILWKHDEIVRWQEERKQRHPSDQDKERIAHNRQRGLAFAKTMFVALFVVVGAGILNVIVNSPPKSNPTTSPATPVTSAAALPQDL
jgi:hypothetical protein